jgi:hypothetical protein
MTLLTLELSLPEPVAQAARQAGLLTTTAIQRLIEQELQRQRQVNTLFAAIERLAEVPLAPLSTTEVEIEIAAVRHARRA